MSRRVRARRLLRQRRRPLMELLRYLVLLLFLAFAVFPLLLAAMTAVKPSVDVIVDPFGLPHRIRLANFVDAWNVGHMGEYTMHTVIYAVCTVTAVAVLGSLAGYGLARIHFFGRSWVAGLILLGLVVPLQSFIIPLYYLLRDFGLIGSYLAVILPATALGLPFATFLMRAFFQSLPEELAEAGRLDGCGKLGVFWHVMLPLARPALTTLIVVQMLSVWNYFLLPLVVAPDGDRRPIALALMFFQGQYAVDRAQLAAAALIATVPVLVVYLAVQRHFVRGVAAGAVK